MVYDNYPGCGLNNGNEILNEKSVLSEIVLNNYQFMLVMERFGIELGQSVDYWRSIVGGGIRFRRIFQLGFLV